VPVPPDVRQFLDGLPESALVLDVGGWAASDPRADWVIDIGSFATRGYYATSLGDVAIGSERVTHASWVVQDISDPEPWPFDDGMFDYVICSHTLEDIRDPIRVCREIVRVGRAGYIETPGAATEVTRGIESPLWCGWHHHRWLVSKEAGGLSFLFKPHHIHSPFWPDTFNARENVLVDLDDLDGHLQALARSAELHPSRRTRAREVKGAVWSRYYRLRSVAASAARRASGR